MHGRGQGATLVCGTRMDLREAKKAVQDRAFHRLHAMVSESLQMYASFDDQFHRPIIAQT